MILTGWQLFLGVALLGGAGSVVRLLLANFNGFLPWGILLANCLASALAGACLLLADSSAWAILLTTGFAGGLSTFSSWAGQTATFWRNNQRVQATLNLLLNLFLTVTSVLVGVAVAASLLK
jgi:CrcB protein